MTEKSDSNKPKYFGFIVILSIALLISIFILLKILNYFTITERMLFWFFAASSQSMAAMFAVVGMFSVFRFQAQENRLRNLIDIFKNWVHEWIEILNTIMRRDNKGVDRVFRKKKDRIFERDPIPSLWKDNIVVEMGKGMLKSIHADRANDPMVIQLRERIEEIEKHQKIRNNIIVSMKIPMLAILISFMLSTVFLALTVTLSNSIAGFVILMVMLAMIAFSVISVFKYIMFSISLGR